jgi:hypothetical protein
LPYTTFEVTTALTAKSDVVSGFSRTNRPTVCKFLEEHTGVVAMAAKPNAAKRSTNEPRSKVSVSYNDFKEHEGQRYTGMKIGRSHKWYYDKGEWRETKITPDLWQITYAVTKRRAGHAPKGSGVPVGTEYHWYVLAHQNTTKRTANDYTTSMTGLKFKIAHKRAGSEKWSATPRTQRKRMIMFLESVIRDLQKQNERDVSVVTTGGRRAASARRTARAARSVSSQTTQRRRVAGRVAPRRRPSARRTRRVGIR